MADYFLPLFYSFFKNNPLWEIKTSITTWYYSWKFTTAVVLLLNWHEMMQAQSGGGGGAIQKGSVSIQPELTFLIEYF